MSAATLVSTSSAQTTVQPTPKIIVRDYAYKPVKVYEIIPQPLSSSSSDSSMVATPTTPNTDKVPPVIGCVKEREDVVLCDSPECSDDEDGVVWITKRGGKKPE
ncbi:hypothetical protein I302_107152 [Kwoniella bestiolae CBS 10118]|uniref:Uncharacterized protein n=1 Tax=Kwoniella bestiolae CBS 10118 TaxID=1296100 RepID=A0A1B9FZC3_9TREE|nr:hypothetical protein I302_05581 [Kwoniella bestiolae CBS 10118]OCF24123.1 hypothetical protein I302_05581 [Kwoniella bestiolae CBS 10118]